ncbi:MAG: superoxide dismutase family protein [Hyphomonadaceae bacterium]
MRNLAALCLAAVLGACAGSEREHAAIAPPAPRSAWIVGGQGAAIGQATFTEGPTGVLIRLEFSANALPPGWHGLHIHNVGDCSDVTAGFQISGGHIGHGQGGRQHGLLNQHGPEQGDLPSVFAAANTPFAAEVFSTGLTLASEGANGRMPLLDRDGAALVVHANVDDQVSQPVGGAGARLGCAALTPTP